MNILHICIGNPYTEGMYYKENYLVAANCADGHNVTVLADTRKWSGAKVVETSACDLKVNENLRVIRVKMVGCSRGLVYSKLRMVRDFSNIIDDIKPDVILFHCMQQRNILKLKDIKAKYPYVKVYADSSTTEENSGRNVLSKEILHKRIYARWIKKALPYFDKIFYVEDKSKYFLQEIYKVPDRYLEFSPLPGMVLDKNKKREYREEVEKKHRIGNKKILFHSGKMGKRKKTIELLRLFLSEEIFAQEYILFIAGSFEDDIREEAEQLIQQSTSIIYLGFLNQEEMSRYLAAADIYLQPGTASQTAQAALACGTPIVVAVYESYYRFIRNSGYIVSETEEIRQILKEGIINPAEWKRLSDGAYKVAEEMLDYRKLARRLYE